MIVQIVLKSRIRVTPEKDVIAISKKVSNMEVRWEIFIQPNREDLNSGTIM